MTSVPVNHVELERENRDCVPPLSNSKTPKDDVLDDIWRESWSDDEEAGAAPKKRLTAVSKHKDLFYR